MTRKNRPPFFINSYHAVILLLWKLLFRVLNRVEIRGEENIPRRGERGVVLLYRHVSAIDPFLVASVAMPLYSPVWWRAPAKEELYRVPLVREIISSWGAFPVRRGKGDFKAIRKMAALLADSVLVIAPEGRRGPPDRPLPGRPGVGKILYDARARKVIPVAILGMERILPKGSIIPRVGRKTTIIFGSPVDIAAYYELPNSAETSQKIVDRVMEEMNRLLV